MNNKLNQRQLVLGLLSGSIVLCFILAVLVGLIIGSRFPKDTTSDPTPDIIWEDYPSNKYNFNFKHPQDWRREAIPKDALKPWRLEFYLPNEEKPIMRMIVEELNTLYSLPEYWDNILNLRLKNRLSNYTLEERQTTSINLKIGNITESHPAYIVRYSYEKDGQFIEAMRLITVYNKRGYHLIFNANINDYQQYKSTAEKIIQSFELTDP